ncbi:MAG: NAD(P)H-dependent oxidoreductase subunit E [Planctomycetota bacterium]|nr:NAD(P)H-dependent oxidoreductase subunit E [Planctomycetota bacterium]
MSRGEFEVRSGIADGGAAEADAVQASGDGGAACACRSGASAPDLSAVGDIVASCGRDPAAAIPILQAIQKRYGYLPREAMERACLLTGISPAVLSGIATFYTQFRHSPAGRHIARVCHGTACHVKGSELIEDALRRHLKLEPGRDTDPNGTFTIERVACVGCCTLAPVVVIDGTTYGRNTPGGMAGVLREFLASHGVDMTLEAARRAGAGSAAGTEEAAEIRIGAGSCCIASGSLKVRDAIAAALKGIGAEAKIRHVGCVGMCHAAPLVEIAPPGAARGEGPVPSPLSGRAQTRASGGSSGAAGAAPATSGGTFGPPGAVIYAKVPPGGAARIVREHFRPGSILKGAKVAISEAIGRFLEGGAYEKRRPRRLDTGSEHARSFLGMQFRIATELCGSLDPLDLDAYLSSGGFSALSKAVLELGPEDTIAAIERSGLRGRGGAGFPTGRKWSAVRAAPGESKYMLCNGDEGDPGAFMDRMLLESYPFRVLEGMAIAAFAIGAREGFLYIRAEYPLAVERIRAAIGMLETRGLLGEAIFGGKFGLRLYVKEGAGAFVCGEETAMIASIEGRRGMPRIRPPYPAEKGLWGMPTCVNNVETLAVVPWIIRNGPEAFAALGTAGSKGTKVFALAGKVRRGGLIEVPMGITIREIVEEIGGGVTPGRKFKAVQIGGPSGGCIPASMADIPVDYEALVSAGAIMGSGGFVVMDDTDCMVDIARYFLSFTQDQSCGRCTFCRTGTRRMLEILQRLCEGRAAAGDLERLEELASLVKGSSLCGLGRTAPNPVLTTLRYFRDEYEAHIEGCCPAGRCRTLISYRINDKCIGCTRCAQACPADAIRPDPYEKHEVDDVRCERCGICISVCPTGAVEIAPRSDRSERSGGTVSP